MIINNITSADFRIFIRRTRHFLSLFGWQVRFRRRLSRNIKQKKDWLDNELKRIEQNKRNDSSETIKQQSLLEFRRAWFKRFEEILDAGKDSSLWLGNAEIRQIVAEKLLEDDVGKYRLDAFCLMSNHVHVVFKSNISQINLREDKTSERPKFVSEEEVLPKIMQSLKGSTARKANLILNRTGTFWETESYDHFIHDDAEFYRIIKYILNNPVKPGLVNHWQDWAGTYLAARPRDKF